MRSSWIFLKKHIRLSIDGQANAPHTDDSEQQAASDTVDLEPEKLSPLANDRSFHKASSTLVRYVR